MQNYVYQDTFLARAFAGVRTLRIADGPDEVHLLQVAKDELKEYAKLQPSSMHAKL